MVDTSILRASYVAFGRRIFPLHGWDSELIAPKDRGKVPVVARWQNTSRSDKNIFRETDYQGREAGMALDPTDLVLDVDVRNEKKGLESLGRLSADIGVNLMDLAKLKVRTGSGGYHLFFSKEAQISIPKKIKAYPDIDFLGPTPGIGYYVVTAGSMHSTGKAYEFTFDSGEFTDITPAPESLLSLIGKVRSEKETFSDDHKAYDASEANVKRAQEYCRKLAPAAVEGKGGDDTTYKVACAMCDFGLPPKVALKLMFDEYNNRCSPPWSLEELRKKIYNAYNYHREQFGNKTASAMFEQIEPAAPVTLENAVLRLTPQEDAEIVGADWMNDLRRNDRGAVKSGEYMNALLYLKNDPDTRFSLVKNLFNNRINKINPMPWDYHKSPNNEVAFPKEGLPWTEEDLMNVRAFFNRRYRFDCSLDRYMEVVNVLAGENSSHPVREYLTSLKWDGVPRVNSLFERYAEANVDKRYLAEVSRIMIIGAVKRVFEPGCKMDYVVVLEGVQGLGKSQFIRALAGCDEWFTDRLPDDEREAAIKMQGKWFIELGELASITRKDVDKLKAFITSQNDECRLPYGRMTVNLPRQCLFVGSTNSSSYLRDETGERRFFPVSCVKLNLADLRRDRDQIFAEAFARYKEGGEELYIKDPIVQAIATRQQRMRTVADPWVQLIAPFLDGKNPDKLYYDKITPLEIWEKCFTRLGSNITAIDNSRIMRSLAVIGWDKHLAESDGVSTLVYERPQEYSFL